MAMQFQRATKKACKLRVAIYGPAGAGKTYTALRMAKGIGGPVAVIDTEAGTSEKYADRFDFDVLKLEQPTIDRMIEAWKAAVDAGYRVVVVDSLSHVWQELLDELDRATKASKSQNSFRQWAEFTPKQRRFIKAMLRTPFHLICTMRAKTEWAVSDGREGKSAPQRLGLAPVQGKEIEFEFDVLGVMTTDHYLTVEKDRTGRLQDAILEKPGEEFGAELCQWAESGELPEREPPKDEPAAKPASAKQSGEAPKAEGPTLGKAGETRIAARLAPLKLGVGDLRKGLTEAGHKIPAGAPATWPLALGPHIAAWFDIADAKAKERAAKAKDGAKGGRGAPKSSKPATGRHGRQKQAEEITPEEADAALEEEPIDPDPAAEGDPVDPPHDDGEPQF